MKKQLSIILGALSICCFVSADVTLSEKTTDENSTKTRDISYKKPFSPAYATLIQDTTYPDPAAIPSWIQSAQITVPFNSIQAAKNITFDETATPDSFILPKGVYTFDFQFTMEREGPAKIFHERDFRFTDMYLDLNNGSSKIALDWTFGFNSSTTFNTYLWATFTGSRIFSIGTDNTLVKFILVRDSAFLGNIRFTFDQSATPTLTTENSPVRITIHKIDGCDQVC